MTTGPPSPRPKRMEHPGGGGGPRSTDVPLLLSPSYRTRPPPPPRHHRVRHDPIPDPQNASMTAGSPDAPLALVTP